MAVSVVWEAIDHFLNIHRCTLDHQWSWEAVVWAMERVASTERDLDGGGL